LEQPIDYSVFFHTALANTNADKKYKLRTTIKGLVTYFVIKARTFESVVMPKLF